MFKKSLLLITLLFTSLSAFAVNVNTATAKEIATALEGIGESKAGAIVIYRNEHGPFKTLRDLTKVKGIGAATIDKNREGIELGLK